MTGKTAAAADRVFISYSHKDRDRVQAYLQKMCERSIPFWYDSRLLAGSNFNNEIANHIHACDVLVLFLSQASADSWYVPDEVTLARNDRKHIFIIQLDRQIDMPSGLELNLVNINRVTPGEDGMDACLDQLEAVLNGGDYNPSAPISEGLLNHDSDLLKRCRESFGHLASQLGVHDLEKGIDENLFCPIYAAGQESAGEAVELYDRIREDDHTHILLQADGGLGKTYTFLHVMHLLLQCDHPCAYIPCYLFTGSDGKDRNLILKTLSQLYLTSGGSDEAALDRYFRAQTSKVFHLFLDGYNEAVAKSQLAMELAQISSKLPGVKIVISSRYSDPVFANYAHYTMSGLNTDKVKKMLKEHGRDYDRLNIGLRKLLLTPMFLSLFIRMKNVDEHIDTAAELMDRERKRIIEAVSRGGSEERTAAAAECLGRVYPGFVRHEYLVTGHELSFSGARLMEYLEAHASRPEQAEGMFGLLTQYSVILKGNERRNSYAYQHEHFRDYYVAYDVFRDLRESLDLPDAAGRAAAVLDALDGGYSRIVLRYIGELAQAGVKGGLLEDALDALRRDAVADDDVWLSARTADVTARIIDIFMLTHDNSLVGMDFDGLNLKKVQLNQARTCTRKDKASFRNTAISEETFIVSMHESAPRRVEVLRLDGRCFLVTVSNQDMLISALPEMEKVWRYPHLDADGKLLSTHTILSSTMMGGCLLAVDSAGDVWEWDFSDKGGVPCVSAVRKHPDAAPAVKVFPWSDAEGALIALQRKDGTVLQFAVTTDPETDAAVLGCLEEEYRLPFGEDEAAMSTVTSVSPHVFFCWASARQDGIHVFRYDLNEGACRELCMIPDAGLKPDRMICVGSEQSSRDDSGLDFGASPLDGTMLILTAVGEQYTRVYQIWLTRRHASGNAFTALTWQDGRQELVNSKGTEQHHNRINAMSFAEGKMLLAASDGRIYRFRFDEMLKRYVPDPSAPFAAITRKTFAVEDVLFVSPDTLAAVCVDRSVHLLDARSMFPKKILPGYNDGLRQMMIVRDGLVMAAAYDGCLLELARGSGRWVCRDKLPVAAGSSWSRGNWCWSLEKIDTDLYAVGCMNDVALVDTVADRVLCRSGATNSKIEHLLFLPDLGNTLIASCMDGAHLYTVVEEDGETALAEKGVLSMPETPACYWITRDGDFLYASVNVKDNREMRPRVMRYSLKEPLIGQEPVIIETGAAYGRVRDIHVLDRFLMASGLCGDDGKRTSSTIGFFDLDDGFRPVLTLADYKAYIIHSAVWQAGDGMWRAAVIDGQANGCLRQYLLTASGGALEAELLSETVFPAVLCDVAFDGAGDLMVTALNGCLYAKKWAEEGFERLFRNKCYMLTFGADMSALHGAVDPSGRLGTVLADFGNRLERSARVVRKLR